jgi:hypothetical protein
VKLTYRSCKNSVKRSESFETSSEVRQGNALSPTMLNTMIDKTDMTADHVLIWGRDERKLKTNCTCGILL